MTKFTQILKQTFLTHIGRLMLGLLLLLIGSLLFDGGLIGYIGLVLFGFESFLMIAHGLVINPIREWKRKREIKKLKDESE